MARAIEQLKQAMEACELGALTLPDQVDALMDAGKAILQEVSTLTPQNEWVSVEERMPEEEHLVLAYSKMFGAAVAMLYSGSWYGYNGEEGDYCSPYFYVTHWMHLPEPPGTGLSSG